MQHLKNSLRANSINCRWQERCSKELLKIESTLGRQRTIPKAARTIDIDIIDYEGFFLQSEELTLPHPRAHERKFVLEPWAEIDPDAELLGYGPIKELLAALE